MAAGHSAQFTPMRLPVNTVIHTTLAEPTTFRSLVRRATGSDTEPTAGSVLRWTGHMEQQDDGDWLIADDDDLSY